MVIFVDTSAFYALLDEDDDCHQRAAETFIALREAGAQLVTSNYVVAESCALIQKRLGMKIAGMYRSGLLAVVSVRWVTQAVHEDGFNCFLACGRNGPSFTDSVSFSLMRDQRIDTAFAFDKHFADQGFKCLTRPEDVA